jgi:hypothetical protein
LGVPPHIFVPDRELDFLTDSHIKLDILVDTQEPFNDSHHKIAFDYNEDTVSLVEELTLATLEVSLSNNSNPLLGMHPQLLNMNAMRLRMMHLDLTTMDQKIKTPKQELPVTICTADTIGTIRSPRLF